MKSSTLRQKILSVLAAFIGVQSSTNRHRDFKQGNAKHFIIIAVLLTVVLVLSLMGVVLWVVVP